MSAGEPVPAPAAAVPELMFRLSLAGVALLLVLVFDTGRSVSPGPLLALVVLGGWMAARPGSVAPALFLASILLAELQWGDGLSARVLVEAPLLYAAHLLASVTALVPRGGLIELPALRATAVRWLLAVVACAPVAVLAAVVQPGPISPVALLAAAAAAIAVLLAPALLARRPRG